MSIRRKWFCIVTSCAALAAALTLPFSSMAAASSVWVEAPPLNVPNLVLGSVVCPSSSTCFAAGNLENGSSSTAAMYATTNGGVSWVQQSVPPVSEPGNAGILGQVSCPSTTECFVTGGTVSANSSFIDETHDGGSTWTSAPVSSAFRYDGISCPAVSTCFAFANSSVTFLMSTTDGGASWTEGPPIRPNNAFDLDGQNSIACTSVTSCFATGTEYLGGTDFEPIIAMTSDAGQTWTGTAFPSPSYLLFNVISCGSANFCVAVGSSGSPDSSITETTVNGGQSWTQGTLPTKYPEDASCGTPTTCTVVGWTNGNGTPGTIFATSDAGTSWQAESFPASGVNPLDSVGCFQTFCVASGGEDSVFYTTTGGNANFYGSMGGKSLNKPIVGMAVTPQGGYYEVASDGGIFAFGPGANFYGSMGGQPLNKPIVGMAATPQGGYYEVASDGGIFAFGPGANFYGSMGGKPLNKPIVGMAVTPQGGYYEVASDGGIFAFGPGANFYGSMGGQPLNKPIVGMAVTPQGGYWEVASDGGIFAF